MTKPPTLTAYKDLHEKFGEALNRVEVLQREVKNYETLLDARDVHLKDVRANSQLVNDENGRLRKELQFAKQHELETFRLRGMIEGFERAGKIEPVERMEGFDTPPRRFVG